MPDFGHPFSGLAKERKLTGAELIRVTCLLYSHTRNIKIHRQLRCSR